MTLHQVNRRVHLYLALFLLPWFLMYGVSSIAFSHGPYFEELDKAKGIPLWTQRFERSYEAAVPEGPWSPGSPNAGVDRLLESVRAAGIGVGGNVYAELGSTWRTLMGSPHEAAHVLGKVIAALGPDNVLWGTDSIWYGSPQDQIEAFRAFEITADAQERFGYAPLTPAVKAGILADNAARLYGVDPAALPCSPSASDRQALRADPPTADRLLGPTTASAARRAFRADHPWF